jgi:malate dehydrogenase (oxaloacetate-decarboxylating)(NADP+)
MTPSRTRRFAIVAVLLVSAWAGVRAGEEAGAISAERHTLDEYNADVWRTPDSAKVQGALEILRQRGADFVFDGEMQADTAVVPEIIEERYPFSKVKDANVLVFPSLEAANIAYKLLARLGNAQAIGPILLGMGAPVHVLQTGDEVRDIVNIAAVAVMDAMSRD